MPAGLAGVEHFVAVEPARRGEPGLGAVERLSDGAVAGQQVMEQRPFDPDVRGQPGRAGDFAAVERREVAADMAGHVDALQADLRVDRVDVGEVSRRLGREIEPARASAAEELDVADERLVVFVVAPGVSGLTEPVAEVELPEGAVVGAVLLE
jgi:hypothetical protein